MKTSELVGTALDWAVAKTAGWVDYPSDSIEKGSLWHTNPSSTPFDRTIQKILWNPSTDWSQGGPIIEREHLSVNSCPDGITWFSTSPSYDRTQHGPSPLIAAMRCYVASKVGNTVEISEELIGE